jgi:hypothetical protein
MKTYHKPPFTTSDGNRERLACKLQERSQFICFNLLLNESVRYQCRSFDRTQISDKEIFSIDNYYFFYLYNRNGRITTFSLREISKAEYETRKAEFLPRHPNYYTTQQYGEWKEGNKEFFVGLYKNCPWEKAMPLEDCIFTSESILKKIYDDKCKEIAMQQYYSEEIDKSYRYEYARKCGGLAKKHNIAFENAMRIGPNEDNLLEFKSSYFEAIKKIQNKSLSEVRKLHILIFRRGRTSRKNGLDLLGIKYFDADVNLLNLSELEEVITKSLKVYLDYAIEEAIKNATDLNFNEREEIYQLISTSNRTQKREILQSLGIDTNAIDISKFPFSILRRKVGASIGIDFEQQTSVPN